MPRSATEKMGASWSLLMATMFLEFFLPQHKHQFHDRHRNGLVFDISKPSGFLTEQEKRELYPLWLSVIQSRDANSALQAIIDKHSITN